MTGKESLMGRTASLENERDMWREAFTSLLSNRLGPYMYQKCFEIRAVYVDANTGVLVSVSTKDDCQLSQAEAIAKDVAFVLPSAVEHLPIRVRIVQDPSGFAMTFEAMDPVTLAAEPATPDAVTPANPRGSASPGSPAAAASAPFCWTCDPIEDDEDGMQMYVEARERWIKNKAFIDHVKKLPLSEELRGYFGSGDFMAVFPHPGFVVVFLPRLYPDGAYRKAARAILRLRCPYGYDEPLERVVFALNDKPDKGTFPVLAKFTRDDVLTIEEGTK